VSSYVLFFRPPSRVWCVFYFRAVGRMFISSRL
jgi:hypothetical protein